MLALNHCCRKNAGPALRECKHSSKDGPGGTLTFAKVGVFLFRRKFQEKFQEKFHGNYSVLAAPALSNTLTAIYGHWVHPQVIWPGNNNHGDSPSI